MAVFLDNLPVLLVHLALMVHSVTFGATCQLLNLLVDFNIWQVLTWSTICQGIPASQQYAEHLRIRHYDLDESDADERFSPPSPFDDTNMPETEGFGSWVGDFGSNQVKPKLNSQQRILTACALCKRTDGAVTVLRSKVSVKWSCHNVVNMEKVLF